MTLVGFLGLGEAGSLIAADLAAAGVTVRGWDPLVPESPGVETTAGPAEVAEGADIVVSVNSAHDALGRRALGARHAAAPASSTPTSTPPRPGARRRSRP